MSSIKIHLLASPSPIPMVRAPSLSLSTATSISFCPLLKSNATPIPINPLLSRSPLHLQAVRAGKLFWRAWRELIPGGFVWDSEDLLSANQSRWTPQEFVECIISNERNVTLSLPFEGILEAVGLGNYNLCLDELPFRRAMEEFERTLMPTVCILQTRGQIENLMADFITATEEEMPLLVFARNDQFLNTWPGCKETLLLDSKRDAVSFVKMAYSTVNELKLRRPSVILLSDDNNDNEENIWIPIFEGIHAARRNESRYNGQGLHIGGHGVELAFRMLKVVFIIVLVVGF